MPFHKYSPKTAKTLFKSSNSPSLLSQQTSSQTPRAQSNERKTTSVAEALKDRFEHTRALIASIQKERYDSDLERSRLGLKEAAKARIEAAQRAALDDELRNEALEEWRKQELPTVIQKLEEEWKPKVQEDLLTRLRADLRPKVHAELRTELAEEISQKVWTELRQQLRDDVTEHLRIELHETLAESVRDQLYHELYPTVVAQLKEEYRDMALLQLKDELATDVQIPDINGHTDNAVDPALIAESETSDIGHSPSQLAVIAKRRFSEGFESDDPDTRAKKIKTVNADTDPLAASESLPVSSGLASQRGISAKNVEESLDEGEKADIEDESGSRKPGQQTSEALEEKVKKADDVVTPEDVHAEGDDELSQSDDGKRDAQQQSDRDADAEVETEIDGGLVTKERDGKLQSLSSQQSRNTRLAHKTASTPSTSTKEQLSNTELDREPEPIHFLRKYSLKVGSQKLVASRIASSPSRTAAKPQGQTKWNDIMQNVDDNNDQKGEENEEDQSSSLTSYEYDDNDENEGSEHAQEGKENNLSDASTSSLNPWLSSQNRAYHSLPEDEHNSHLWLTAQEDPYASQNISANDDIGTETEDDQIEGYPYNNNHYNTNEAESEEEEDDDDDDDDDDDGVEDSEEEKEEEEEEEDEAESDDNDDPGIQQTFTPPAIYSQGGRQDDPISLDSD
ncbi:MAG: hypothetical protein GOMPHAMPRED_002411 [Gomphillus americanus]|uniref:Uncharacterized protein n=1 Tax=Gomphillus americanus TaxID=1940652 RepID=A0A8H3FAN0_9LECA|nr:MAG: hypothetical protein GOMPHAMPRED_002411 [Gomphillus americanus]